MVERLVPDGLWALFQRVVPTAPVRPQGGGRRRYGDRQVPAAIVFVATTDVRGASCRPASALLGQPRTGGSWSGAGPGCGGMLHRLVLDELGTRGELDWSRCAIDSVNMRAAKGGI